MLKEKKNLIGRQELGEVDDILGVQGFNWLSNGRDSCWIKVQNH